MLKLGEIAKVTAGQAAPKIFGNDGYPFIRAGHLEELIGGKSLTDLPKVSQEVSKKHRLKLLPKHSIIFAKSGMSATKNRIYTLKEEAYFVSHLAAILPNENIDMNYLSKYLFWYNPTNLILDEAYPSIRLEDINNLKIPLPPLSQQQKLANILDAADALRQNDKALIAKYDELTQALFLDMFGDPVSNPKGWEINPLGKVCKIQGGYSFKSTDFVQSGAKLVKIANVNFQFLDWEDVDLLPMEFIQKHPNFSLNEGDILMALTRPIIKSLGSVKAVTVKKTDLPALLNQRVARFFPKTEVLSKDFLLRIIYSDFFKNKIEKLSSTSLQPNVSNKQVENIEIFLPPLELQNQFAERVAVIEEQKAIAQKSLEHSESLFNSLLQKAFKGELV